MGESVWKAWTYRSGLFLALELLDCTNPPFYFRSALRRASGSLCPRGGPGTPLFLWVLGPTQQGSQHPRLEDPFILVPGVKRAGCPEGAPRPQSLASCRDRQGRSLSPQHQISWRSWPLFLPLLLIELICYQASKGREVPPSQGTRADSLVPASYLCFLD